MNYKYLQIFLLIFTLSCSSTIKKQKEITVSELKESLITDTLSECCCNSILLQTPTYTGAILDTLQKCKSTNQEIQKYWPKNWMPNIFQIDSAEKILERYLKKNESFIKVENLSEYLRQYYGCYEKTGQKVININFFYKFFLSDHPNWRNEYILVYGGGSAYWNIVVNIEEDTCYGMHINSPE